MKKVGNKYAECIVVTLDADMNIDALGPRIIESAKKEFSEILKRDFNKKTKDNKIKLKKGKDLRFSKDGNYIHMYIHLFLSTKDVETIEDHRIYSIAKEI